MVDIDKGIPRDTQTNQLHAKHIPLCYHCVTAPSLPLDDNVGNSEGNKVTETTLQEAGILLC
jgi:hypothetical protein